MFHWKKREDIWKGVGIYHLTFVLRPRRPLLGTLVDDKVNPRTALSQLGIDALTQMNHTLLLRPNIQFLAVSMMPDHIHVLIYVKSDIGESIKQLARGMRQGWWLKDHALDFEPPFIRTLSRKGQLKSMIEYVHDNPRRALVKRHNPGLFHLRRNLPVTRGGHTLTFSAMGNPFLLDYPERQAVQCSRSLTDEQIESQCNLVLHQAVRTGCVTYSGAISHGEQFIMRAVRENRFPMVIVLKDGFPPEGSPHERYFKPGGVYFETCSSGRLLLLEPTVGTAEDSAVVTRTDNALRAKAETRHRAYAPLPHDSARWHMMRNNVLVEWLAE